MFRRGDVGVAAGGVAFGALGLSPLAVGEGILRIEPDRLAVVRDGAVVLFLLLVGIAAAVVAERGAGRPTARPSSECPRP